MEKQTPVSFQKFRLLFSLIVAGELYSRIFSLTALHWVCKPLILLSLSVFFYQQMRAQYNRLAAYIQVGLLFSLAGDVFLLFDGNGPLFFMLGLIAFLLAHMAYILAYRLSVQSDPHPSVFRKKPWLCVPFLLYGAVLYGWLFPHLGDLQLPVLLYTLVLLGMGVFALNRYQRTPSLSFRLVLMGALLFIVSDSVLAIDKFVSPFPWAGVVVMATYSLAQYLIVLGMLMQMKLETQPVLTKEKIL